jgi:hypothetical protein
MACACGKNKVAQASRTYVHTNSKGEKKTYKTEVEAAAAAKRGGGTYRAQS